IELFKIICKLAYNQTKIIMKKSNIQQRKLTKQELKEINGGNRVFCLRGFCMVPGSDELVRGLIGEDGYCC
ncbi:hypothetical protein, partial [Chryseobacterium joostei]